MLVIKFHDFITAATHVVCALFFRCSRLRSITSGLCVSVYFLHTFHHSMSSAWTMSRHTFSPITHDRTWMQQLCLVFHFWTCLRIAQLTSETLYFWYIRASIHIQMRLQILSFDLKSLENDAKRFIVCSILWLKLSSCFALRNTKYFLRKLYVC